MASNKNGRFNNWNIISRDLQCSPHIRNIFYFIATLIVSISFSACGTSDSVGQNIVDCDFDDECPLGQVCGVENICVVFADCSQCLDGQVCYISDEYPQGTCSRKECFDNSGCSQEGQICSGGLCVNEFECTQNSDCSEGQICNHANTCVDDTSDETSCEDSTDCPTDYICDASNQCVADSNNSSPSNNNNGNNNNGNNNNGNNNNGNNNNGNNTPGCTPADCGANERCSVQTGSCVHDCISDSTLCLEDEVCNQTTGACGPDACTTGATSPEQCGGYTPNWNEDTCSCVACVDDSHCFGDDICNDNGQCVSGQCDTPCDPSQAGQCGGSTPFCIGGCCSECIGNADCSDGLSCVSGTCTEPPSCVDDPSVCPPGWECNGSECQAPGGGAACDPMTEIMTPTCPEGYTCGLMTGQCEPACETDADCSGGMGMCLMGMCLDFGF